MSAPTKRTKVNLHSEEWEICLHEMGHAILARGPAALPRGRDVVGMTNAAVLARPDASFSADGLYRYTLTRSLPADDTTIADSARPLVWVMLNPSTADALVDDPTIRRVIGFTRRLGYRRALVVNLFALRATDPRELARHPDPVGPLNDDVLRAALAAAGLVIAAWGAHPYAAGRAARVRDLMREQNVTPRCLGRTKAGHPRHPLYLPSGATLHDLPDGER